MRAFSAFVGKFDYRVVRPLPHFYKPGKQPQPVLAPHVLQSRAAASSSSSSSSSSWFPYNRSTPSSSSTSNNTHSATSDRTLDDPTYSAHRGPTGARIDLGEDYYANDGVVPVFSQWHPGTCAPGHCVHHSTVSEPHVGEGFYFGLPGVARSHPEEFARSLVIGAGSAATGRESESEEGRREALNGIKPGVWNVVHVPESTHVSLMPMWLGTQRQKEFWVEIGEWFEVVDAARGYQRRTQRATETATARRKGAVVGDEEEERCASPGSGSGTAVGVEEDVESVESDGGTDSPSDSEYESMKPKGKVLSGGLIMI